MNENNSRPRRRNTHIPDPIRWTIPALCYLLVIWVLPIVYAAVLSLTNAPTYGQGASYIGLENYKQLFSDIGFLGSLKVTFVFLLGSVALHLAAGFFVAHLILASGKWRGFLQVVVLLPWVVAEIAVALTWRWAFHEHSGMLNLALSYIGAEPVHWLSSPGWALFSILLAHLWRGMALSAMIQLAGLQSIPQHITDAARIDGASALQVALRIRLPLLRPVLMANTALVLLQSMTVFALPYAITGGGPLRSTELLSLFLYRVAFIEGRLGYSAAVGLFMMAVFSVFALLLVVVGRNRHES